ncbi:MAG: amino acid-binding protein [Armatimonadota bacterium]
MATADKITKQVSVFLENKSGRLAEVCDVLGKADVNIRALCIADTSDFGILRLIVDKPHEATEVLKEKGFGVGEADVLALLVPDRPGGLASVLQILEQEGTNVEYMYAFFITVDGEAVVLFRIDDAVIAKTIELLEENGIRTLDAEEVYGL